jgi:O-methyltransferase
MRVVLAAFGDETRCVWLADSFAGVPRPDTANYKADKSIWIRFDLSVPILAVPQTEVRANFQRYGLLDDQVRFLPGWFKDTLHDALIDRIALLRLDGDLDRYLYSNAGVGPDVSRVTCGFVVIGG